MDKDKNVSQNNTDLNTREAVKNQLDSFINQTTEPKDKIGIITSGLKSEIKKDYAFNVPAGLSIKEEQKQNRPIIRTYKSDVEETIQTSHLSSINIAMAENKKLLGQARMTEIETKKAGLNKKFLIISIVLVFGGLLAFLIPQYLIQLQYGVKPAPVESVSSKPIITVDVEDKINIKDLNLDRVSTTLKERVDQSATRLGQIKNIYLTEGDGTAEKLITSRKFLELIGATIPSEIQRTLKDPYMFGLYTYNGNQRFLILKVGSYDIAYSGMFIWEPALWQNFKELFSLQADISASSTLDEISPIKFQDATFNNKDCRIVKDSEGNIKFLYSLIDENTIVITTSVDTLNEIISRISKARIVTQ